ncbi:unnamed protein product [Withania somnifera]
MKGKAIDGKLECSQQSADEISHLSIDIGGSLFKIVYFSTNNKCSTNDEAPTLTKERQEVPNGDFNHHILSGRLYFVKFETSKIEECIKYLSSKKLQQCGAQCHPSHAVDKIKIKATSGGAFNFANLFKEKLGITLDKVEEMESLVTGANFRLRWNYATLSKEILAIVKCVLKFQNDLYNTKFLIRTDCQNNIMAKVDGDGKFQRVSGTSVGGGTFLGLGKLLTKCQRFGLASTAIASSFGKAISENKELKDYKPEDIARSLLRMISNNIGQIAYLNALRFGLKHIFLGGFFIRDHAYTMDTISVAVDFWSKGEAKAMFNCLRHQGFLGALGAFMYYKDGSAEVMPPQLVEQQPPKSSSCIVDRIHNSTRVQENENGATDCRLRVSSSFKIYDEVKRC